MTGRHGGNEEQGKRFGRGASADEYAAKPSASAHAAQGEGADSPNVVEDDFFEGAIELDAPDDDVLDMEANAVDGHRHHRRNFPRGLKLFGVLCIITSFAAGAMMVLAAMALVFLFLNGRPTDIGRLGSGPVTIATVIITLVQICLYTLIIRETWRLGRRLIRNDHHSVGAAAHMLTMLYVLATLCDVMLTGLDVGVFVNIAIIVVMESLSVYADPALRGERELQRRLGKMQLRQEAEDGTLGLDTSGRGYIKLNFFNLFWVFVVCSLLGWGVETVYHMTVVDPGVYQERAGLLYGPFSPIYGVGGTLLTMALNRFRDKNLLTIFLVSAVVGGAFEYFVSWFMQFSFGITAWDYTGTFLSIDGRTNGQFMAMWGVMGVIWIRLILPIILKLVNKIPWNWRYAVTTVCAVLMLADALLTLSSLDCWYQREAGTMGETSKTVIDDFCNKHYSNEFMQNRFQSMSMDTSEATRIN